MTFYIGNIPNPTVTRTILTGNTATTVVASANRTRAIARVRIVNVHSSAVTFVLDAYDGTTARVLANNYSIATSDAWTLTDELLEVGESLRVTSGNASGLLHVHAIHALDTPGQ